MLLALLASLSSDQDALATLYGAAGGAAWGWKNDGWLSAGGPCEFQASGRPIGRRRARGREHANENRILNWK